MHEAVELDFGLAGVLSTVTMDVNIGAGNCDAVNSIAETGLESGVLAQGKRRLTDVIAI